MDGRDQRWLLQDAQTALRCGPTLGFEEVPLLGGWNPFIFRKGIHSAIRVSSEFPSERFRLQRELGNQLSRLLHQVQRPSRFLDIRNTELAEISLRSFYGHLFNGASSMIMSPNPLDRMTRSALESWFRVRSPWRAPRHRSALR